jgi:hypothetical protein
VNGLRSRAAPRYVAPAAVGLALAILAPYVTPSSSVLPAPDTLAGRTLGSLVLAAAFAAGFLRPRPALYALVLVIALEGAVRKWLVNDIVVFLLKDFLALGLYAAVLPRLSRREWRRSWWVVVPLATLLTLAVVYCARSESFAQAAIGLRGYAMYVPMLWAAPALLDTTRRVGSLLWLIVGLGVFESVLGAAQTLTANRWLNEVVPGVLPATIVVDGISHLRPSGTMPQVGTLAMFLMFAVLAAFAFVAHSRTTRMAVPALAAISLLTWGVLYTASRSVFLPGVACGLVLLLHLARHRRLGPLVGVVVAVAAGYLVLSYQPFVGGAVREGSDSHFLRNERYVYIDGDGRIKTLVVTIERGEPRASGGFAARGAGEEPSSVATRETPAGRLGVLRALKDEHVVGQGTGAISQGSQYLLEPKAQGAESGYVKVAHELGLVALVPFAAVFLALWFASARAAARIRDGRRPAASLALGAATVVPLVTLISFASDYPMVSLLYYAVTGLALAWTSAPPAVPDGEEKP